MLEHRQVDEYAGAEISFETRFCRESRWRGTLLPKNAPTGQLQTHYRLPLSGVRNLNLERN
jgi:hypothetical protein